MEYLGLDKKISKLSYFKLVTGVTNRLTTTLQLELILVVCNGAVEN